MPRFLKARASSALTSASRPRARISGGVRVWALERYIVPDKETGEMLTLNADRWTLEIYQTVMGTLQSVAWMLLVFFLFALIAFVIVKGLESRNQSQ